MIIAICISVCLLIGFTAWCCCRMAAMSEPISYIYEVEDEEDHD